ncbi:MAG: hypothetical protein FWC38_05110 [Proteobacteria bacterium]|nr:hypothetical protein [Pseudomonadota bacterium]MCL2307598.1 hypothetical protein [Pseudomonadota bacterium]
MYRRLKIFRDGTKTFLAASALLALAGCAAVAGLDGDTSKQAEAPDYRVGDRWEYHVKEGYRLPAVWDETWEIVQIGAEGITVQVTRKGENIDDTRTERWPQPGLVSQGALMNIETRQFNTPYQRYRFPMRAGDFWSQRLDTVDAKERYGQTPNLITRAWGWGKIKTPVGEVDALKLSQNITFDDDDPWRWATQGHYELWYAPAVNNIVYAERRARYSQKGEQRGEQFEISAQFEIIELRSYTRGKP